MTLHTKAFSIFKTRYYTPSAFINVRNVREIIMKKAPLPANAVKLVKDYLLALQNTLCSDLERLDGHACFLEDAWSRKEGGGGITRIINDGTVFAKAGVNFSHVTGESLPPSATANRPELANRRFTALGVSVVTHPDNPYVPTSHANVRFFIAEKEGSAPVWWFGGGFDLTPYYGFKEDCQHWHQMAKNACQPFGSDIYLALKHGVMIILYQTSTRSPWHWGAFFDDYHKEVLTTAFHS